MLSATNEEGDHTHADRTFENFETQIENIFVDMLALCSSTYSNRVKTASARLLETTVIEQFSHEAAEDVSKSSAR